MHRDFKTENILLTTDGVVKIADFGLSRRISDPLATLQKEIYTPNVVTQWYRAPEILLGDSQYNEQVDMWSMGCVMGEFWNRSAILPGGNEIGQIKLISKLCGSIKPENWPNVVNMRGFQQIKLMPTDSRKTRFYLKGKTPKVPDDQANDFFDRLLECNPEKRFNAARALNDNFFYTSPLPTKCLKNFMNRILPILRSPTSIALNWPFDLTKIEFRRTIGPLNDILRANRWLHLPFGSLVKLEMVCLNQLEKLSNGNFLIKHIISINYKFSLSPVSRSSQALNLFALSLSLHLSWHFPWTSITKYESFSLWQWSTICDCNQYKDWKK